MAVVNPDVNLAPSYAMIQQALQQRAQIAGQEGALNPLSTINAIATPIAQQQQLASAQQFELDKIRQKSLLDLQEKKATAKPTITVTQEGIDEFMEAYNLDKKENPDFAKDLLGKNMTEDEIRDEAYRRITALETKRGREESAATRKELQEQRQADLQSEREEKHQEKLRQDVLNYSNKLESNPVIKEAKKQNVSTAKVDELVELAKSGNTIAASSLGVTVAKSMGEVGVLTESDIKRYVESGAITRALADKLSRMIKGKPTDLTLDEIQEVAKTMKTAYHEKVQSEYNTFARRLAINYGMSTAEAATRLDVDYSGNPIKKLRNKKTGKTEFIEFDKKSGKPLREIKVGGD